tara:strand:- start:316 stop:603 length:288 start_codon:yes stop_codon:yes gene_type:complete
MTMLTVNLTEEQLSLMEELVGEKFKQVANAWLPAEETKDMNKLCYDTMLNLRCVRLAKLFDDTLSDNPFYGKKEYLRDVGLITDEEFAQQGICGY